MNAITQLIATQAQRNKPTSPINMLAGIEQIKSSKLGNETAQYKLNSSKQQDGTKFAANIKRQLDTIEDPAKKAEVYATARHIAKMNGHDITPYPETYNEQAQQLLDLSYMQAYEPDSFKKKGFQFGSQIEFKDSENNLYMGTLRQDPNTGEVAPALAPVGNAPATPIGALQMVNSTGLTADERVDQKKNEAAAGAEGKLEKEIELGGKAEEVKEFGKLNGRQRAERIDGAFDRIMDIDKNISNIDRAIGALDKGAKTGAIESRFFPTITAATVELEQVQRELGLDVLNAATFGALSEKELEMALETALPTKLPEPELRQFLLDKKASQEKLRAYFEEQMEFLDNGGTIQGFVRKKKGASRGKYKVGQIIESGGQKYRVTGGDMNDPDVELVP